MPKVDSKLNTKVDVKETFFKFMVMFMNFFEETQMFFL